MCAFTGINCKIISVIHIPHRMCRGENSLKKFRPSAIVNASFWNMYIRNISTTTMDLPAKRNQYIFLVLDIGSGFEFIFYFLCLCNFTQVTVYHKNNFIANIFLKKIPLARLNQRVIFVFVEWGINTFPFRRPYRPALPELQELLL